MAEPQEIPQLANELVDMSREYLRQEVVNPAKELGKHAGMGVGGAMVLSFGAFLMAWGVYHGFKQILPDGAWWVVLARFLTALACLVSAGLVGWRMSVDD